MNSFLKCSRVGSTTQNGLPSVESNSALGLNAVNPIQ